MTKQWISIALKVSLFFAIVANPQLRPFPLTLALFSNSQPQSL